MKINTFRSLELFLLHSGGFCEQIQKVSRGMVKFSYVDDKTWKITIIWYIS